MKSTLLILSVFLLLQSCTGTLEINDPHEPVLQVDAVFYANQPLPTIEVKQSFQAKGSRIYEIPKSELFLSGADIILLWNGSEIQVEEESVGVYRGISTDSVQAGDIFEIDVQHGGRRVTSTAVVPDFPLENIMFEVLVSPEFSPVEFLTYDSLQRSVPAWIASPIVKMTLPFIPAFFNLESGSVEKKVAYDRYRYTNYSNSYPKSYLGSDYPNQSSLSITSPSFTYFLDSLKPADDSASLHFTYTLVIGEPIYAEFFESITSLLIPMTVTNVEGGVGLFMGAIREERTAEVEVPVVYAD